MIFQRKLKIAVATIVSLLSVQLSISQCPSQTNVEAISKNTKEPAAVAKATPGGAMNAQDDSNYLNEQQRQLGQSVSQDFSHYFYFEDNPDFSEFKAQCKPWTEPEKLKIVAIVSKTLKRAPGLVVRAAGGERLPFCRVSTFPETQHPIYSLPTAENPRSEASALTGISAIVITDQFFRSSKQSLCVIHELVHAADCGYRVAFSKLWIGFANPIISAIRSDLERVPQEDRKSFQLKMRKEGRWVSIYGCTDLSEALADYLAEYVEGSGFPISQMFLDQIGSAFLLPTADDLLFSQHLRHGREYSRLKKYTLARAEYEAAIKIDASAFTPYIALMASTADCSQEQTLAILKRAVETFDKSEIPPSERRPTLSALALRATLLMQQCQYKQASEVFSEALKYQPGEPLFLSSRGYCSLMRGFIGDSIKDVYASVRGPLKLEGDAKLAADDLKKREFDHVRKYCESAIAIDRNAIEPRIILIELDEATGHITAAREQYTIAKQLIQKCAHNILPSPTATKRHP